MTVVRVEDVLVNVAQWRRGELQPPRWCGYEGDRETGDYCWTWMCQHEARLEDCRACGFCAEPSEEGER